MDRAGRDRDWATPSELGDFTYCRRAWFWRRHPEELPRGWSAPERTEANLYGEAFHARMESEHAAPHHARRTPYVVVLLLALGALAALTFWLGWWH